MAYTMLYLYLMTFSLCLTDFLLFPFNLLWYHFWQQKSYKRQLKDSLCTPYLATPTIASCITRAELRKFKRLNFSIDECITIKKLWILLWFHGIILFVTFVKCQDPLQEPILHFVALFPHSLPVSGNAWVIPCLSQPGHYWKVLDSCWLEHSSVKECLFSHADSKVVYFG